MRLAALAFGCIASFSACGPTPASDSSLSGRQGSFPTGPNESVTPGKTCEHADTYRYPEHIAYCERAVGSGTKNAVIRDYDHDFGYTIENMNRADFKIDHYISLCMGGSNDADNLWPQHKSVYVLTDGIEQKLCELMAQGKMRQAEAITKIKRAKLHLDEAPAMDRDLEARLGHN